MPIITLQRSLRRLGRIRMGDQVATANGKTRPNKLATWRLTSPVEDLLHAAAERYGGEVRPWEGAPGAARQWELYTETDTLDALIPPTDMAFQQFFEMWSGGGCVRRCDGMTEITADAPCMCPTDPDEKQKLAGQGKACKPISRLFVVLPYLPDVGMWHMEARGYYAATELPGTIEILRLASAAGNLIPTRLRIDQRSVKRDGETRNFAVPVIELPTLTTHTLMTGEIPAGEIGPARHQLPVGDTLPQEVQPEAPQAPPVVAGEGSESRVSPRAAGSTSSRGAQPPTGNPSGDGGAFRRAIAAKAARVGFDDAALDSLAKGTVGKPAADIVSSDDANLLLAALDGKTPTPGPRTKSAGERLHADLGRLKTVDGARLSADDQRHIIMCASMGRTGHASELSEQENGAAYQMGKDVADGRTAMADIRTAVADHETARAS